MTAQYDWKTVENLPESKDLPDPFLRPDGTRVASPEEWPEQREYLKAMLSHYMYGPILPSPGNTIGAIMESEQLYNGRAIREKVNIRCGPELKISFDVYIIRPNKAGRFPVITFNTQSWQKIKDMLPSEQLAIYEKKFSISNGGLVSCLIEEEVVCKKDYCIAMFDFEQLVTDDPDSTGQVYSAYPEYPAKAIGVWAWGHMRIIDYLESVNYADMEKIIATGHSRHGKVALCASIYDERIALAAPMGSGYGGAGCYRVLGGRAGLGQGVQETIGTAVQMFPHWFADELKTFGSANIINEDDLSFLMKNLSSDRDEKLDLSESERNFMTRHPLQNENRLPFDLHTAKALIAPRLLISSDGLGDEWANPYGTQVTWAAANEVFRFLGVEGNNAIHLREGGHEFNEMDWNVLLDFSDHMLRGCPKDYAYPINNLYYANAPKYYSWSAPSNE